MSNYFNPYTDQNFFSFFWVLFKRLFAFCSGQLSLSHLVSDEVQILALFGVAISGALVGTFLVLRRMTMLANALSHTILLGIVVAYLILMGFTGAHDPLKALNIPVLIVAALLTGVATTFLTECLCKALKLQEDASIGLVFTTLFALGITLVTLFTRNVHVGTELVMGNVDALQVRDLRLVYSVLFLNALLFLLFFKEFVLTTFDSGLSRALGFSPALFNYLLMVLTSATAISAFRAVGVLMVLAFFVAPVLTARLLTNRLLPLLFLACGVGMGASLVGVALSRHLLTLFEVGLSTGGIVVCTLLLFYLLAVLAYPRTLRARS